MSEMKKITAKELKEMLGGKALTDDELEMVIGGSSGGVNYSAEQMATMAQCWGEAEQQYYNCTQTCWNADDKSDCEKGCDDAYQDAYEACEPMPAP